MLITPVPTVKIEDELIIFVNCACSKLLSPGLLYPDQDSSDHKRTDLLKWLFIVVSNLSFINILSVVAHNKEDIFLLHSVEI